VPADLVDVYGGAGQKVSVADFVPQVFIDLFA